jgi:formylglycine-generating enzyme required for sulfatase activity
MTVKFRIAVAAALVLLAYGRPALAQLLPEKTPKPPKPAAKAKPPAPPVIKIVEPEVAFIKADEFRMGSENGEEDEKPVHRVYVSDFYIAKFSVDNTEYKRFVDATGHRAPEAKEGGRQLWAGRSFPPEIARQPVVNVSWDDAVAYCRWLSQATGKIYRLPTEAEWEKAARGGLVQKKYPWGDDPPDLAKAWFGQTWVGVRTIKDKDYGVANGYGLLGISGNVSQWVSDLYNRHYYSRSSSRDPQGPFGGFDRVVRGGSALEDAKRLRCASRDFRPPTDRLIDVGFRVVRQ